MKSHALGVAMLHTHMWMFRIVISTLLLCNRYATAINLNSSLLECLPHTMETCRRSGTSSLGWRLPRSSLSISSFLSINKFSSFVLSQENTEGKVWPLQHHLVDVQTAPPTPPTSPPTPPTLFTTTTRVTTTTTRYPNASYPYVWNPLTVGPL